MMYLSKSKYCYLWRCPKLAWISKYKPELIEISESDQRKFGVGNQVGDLAMEDSYSIKYVLPALYPDDPSLDYHNLFRICLRKSRKRPERVCLRTASLMLMRW